MAVVGNQVSPVLVDRALALVRSGAAVVAVTGTRASALEAWGRAFARKARGDSAFSLEIYMASTRDALIDRFNQVLTGLTVDQARSAGPTDGPCRIVLVPDVRSLDTPEGLLLARLVCDFPGAGTRLVILVDRDDAERTDSLLQSLGRGMTRLDLDTDAGRSLRATPVADDRPNRSESVPSSPFQEGAPIHAHALRAAEDSSGIDGLPSALPLRRGRSRWVGVSVLLMALVLISTLIVVLLHRERGPGAAFAQRLALEQPASVTPGPMTVPGTVRVPVLVDLGGA